MKTVVAISDLHCGHKCGLTPPDYQETDKTAVGKQQRACWDFYSRHIPKNADVLLVLGDAIDGKGIKSGGTEQSTTDRHEQAEMAAECVAHAKPKRVVMCYGTGYHVGHDEDWEKTVAEKLVSKQIHTEITSHGTVVVDGVTFDIKHKVGASQIPHGRHTASARERLWNVEWFLRGQRPLADVILRAHVHYFQFCGAADWLAITMPALMGLGSKYGKRQCSGTVDFGFLVFKVNAGRGEAGRGPAGRGMARQGEARQGKASSYLTPHLPMEWEPVLMDIRAMKTEPIVI